MITYLAKIEHEIAAGKTQNKIAEIYCEAMGVGCTLNWREINQMVINKWSVSDLIRVKKMAWKMHESAIRVARGDGE